MTIEVAELVSEHTIELPPGVAARFHPSDRFVVWADGDTLHIKRITAPSATQIVEKGPEGEPLPLEEISKIVHEVRKRR